MGFLSPYYYPSHVGVQVGDFPEAGQDSLAAQVLPALFLRFLLQEAIVHGGPVLEHVGADPGFGFGVGGGVGVETGSFGGLTVGHSSRENQVGKGYFLVSDEVADLTFGHKWLRLQGDCEVTREKLRAEVSELRETRWEPMFRFLIMLKK
jgi:hypothetical protein